MPEHFVWAVSNLQRLSHFNRGDPHLRIEAARALVALDAVRRPTWRAAVGITDPCPSLRQIVEDLERAGRRASASGEPRFAAAALLTHGALEAECGASHNGPDPQTQSAWLVASAGVLGDGTAAFAESLRRDLQTALAIDRPDVEAVTDVLRRAATVESELARGRRPEGFERVAAPRDGARFLGKWRQAIHFGVAVELVAAARAVSGGPVPGVSGATAVGSVDAGYIATVDDLASYAGRAPRALYGAREFAAAHSSWFEALEAWLRYRGRSYPAVAWAVLGLFTATLAGIVLIANLSLWRVRLYRTSLYRAELDPEGLAPGPEPGAETADRSAIGPA